MRGGILVAVVLVLAACGSRGPVTFDGAVADAGADALVCAPGLTECGGECVDTDTDPDNCGSCGNACVEGAACAFGVCDDIPPGLTDCAGAFVDLQTDANNCGTCGNRCDTANGFTCQAGTCACAYGLTDCYGECVDLGTDAKNCGGCGCSCGNDVVCYNGACGCSCGSGMMGCTVKGPPPFYCPMCHCVDTNSSLDHCGQCNNACDKANGYDCKNGTCSCALGWTDCGGSVCLDPNSDPNNCGSCGDACPSGQSCVAGVCGGPP